MCFQEQGYHQTGVRDIAARAGVSLGNLYNHFPGKHDVLVEIANLERKEMEPFLGILNEDAPASNVLAKFINAYIKYMAMPENVILGLEIGSEAIRQPDLGELFLENRNELVKALASLIERGSASGEFKPYSEPILVAPLIIETIEGAALRSVTMNVPMGSIEGAVRIFLLNSILSQ